MEGNGSDEHLFLFIIDTILINSSLVIIVNLSSKFAQDVDGGDVDLGYGHGNYSMTMYVADITDNCVLGFDYLKAREAVIDLSQGVLVVNDTIVKGKYKCPEGTPVSTHKVRLVNDCHIFQNSVSRATVRRQADHIHLVLVQARKNGPYLVPYWILLMPEDVSLYIMNYSDSHIQLKDGMEVAV